MLTYLKENRRACVVTILVGFILQVLPYVRLFFRPAGLFPTLPEHIVIWSGMALASVGLWFYATLQGHPQVWGAAGLFVPGPIVGLAILGSGRASSQATAFAIMTIALVLQLCAMLLPISVRTDVLYGGIAASVIGVATYA